MKNPIKTLKITNFKSIKKLDLKCERINVFVGKPNVGKSNILEALSLFCAPFSVLNLKDKNIFSDFIRYNLFANLFYNNDTSNNKPIQVDTNIGWAILKSSRYYFELFLGKDNKSFTNADYSNKTADEVRKKFFGSGNRNVRRDKSIIPNYYERFQTDGNLNNPNSSKQLFHIPIKKYSFEQFDHKKQTVLNSLPYLMPPDGSNLFEILQAYPNLRKEVASYFDEYGLKLLLDFENESLQIQKEVDGVAYKTPFNLIADTLQRIIFHFAAIESNKDSVLLFEEPENHSFPPYIKELAEKIVEDKSNQYFITTHSPYLLNTIIENSDDVAVFVTTFTNYETKVKSLTKDELSELLNHGIDLFFNLKIFENE